MDRELSQIITTTASRIAQALLLISEAVRRISMWQPHIEDRDRAALRICAPFFTAQFTFQKFSVPRWAVDTLKTQQLTPDLNWVEIRVGWQRNLFLSKTCQLE